MKINLPWSKMEEKEKLLWNRFLENYGYDMEYDELDFLEQSYRKWIGDNDFEIRTLMFYGNKEDEIKKI